MVWFVYYTNMKMKKKNWKKPQKMWEKISVLFYWARVPFNITASTAYVVFMLFLSFQFDIYGDSNKECKRIYSSIIWKEYNGMALDETLTMCFSYWILPIQNEEQKEVGNGKQMIFPFVCIWLSLQFSSNLVFVNCRTLSI